MLFQRRHLLRCGAIKQRRVVPGVDIRHGCTHGIEYREEHRHEHFRMRVGQNHVVRAINRFVRRRLADRHRADDRARERHKERGRHPLVRNIRDHDAPAPAAERYKIIEIAADLARSLPHRADFVIGQERARVRQKALLNLSRQAEFVLEPFLALRLAGQPRAFNSNRHLIRDAHHHLDLV